MKPLKKNLICKTCFTVFMGFQNGKFCEICKKLRSNQSKLNYSRKNYSKEKNSIYRKRWILKNNINRRESIKAWRIKKNITEPWDKFLIYAKNRCSSKDRKYYFLKGIKCLLTKTQIKEIWFRDKAYLLVKPSLDRIDSMKNYDFKNCRFIEQKFNSRPSKKYEHKERAVA